MSEFRCFGYVARLPWFSETFADNAVKQHSSRSFLFVGGGGKGGC